MKKLNTLLLTCAALCLPLNIMAGDVIVTTQKAIGDPFTIAADADINITLKWGNGTEEQFASDGQPATFTVKDASLTLSTESDLTRLYMPEDGITELNLEGVKGTLKKLYCPNNELTTLDLSLLSKLTDVDVQENQLTTLKFAMNVTGLENLNCAGNQLTKLNYTFSAAMKNLVIANNQIETIPFITSLSVINSLFAQNNKLASLKLNSAKKLKNLVADDNQLAELDLTKLTGLQELWIANNQIDTLDFSSSLELITVAAPNNKLSGLKWKSTSAASSYSALKNFDVSNNDLCFNSFPTINTKNHPINAVLTPQRPFFLVETTNTNTAINLNQYIRNGWGANVRFTVKAYEGDGTPLVENTDFTQARNINFLTPHTDAYIGLVSEAYYPGVEIFSQHFSVADPNAISLTKADAANNKHEVYTLSGVRVDSKQLSKGVYVINGKKVIIK